MKNTKLTAFALAALLCGTSSAQTNWMDWRNGRPGVQVITNAPSRAEHIALSNLVAGVSAASVSTVGTMITNAVGPLSSAIVSNMTAITALSTGVVDHAAATGLLWTASGHYGTPGRLAGFFEGGMAGYAGFGLGLYLDVDDNIAVSNGIISGAALGATAIQPADTNGWETGSHASFLTSAPPQSVVSVNGLTGAVSITAASIGALTAEQDLAALRLYHYGSTDIVESPAGWFVFNGAGTITAFNWEPGRENVVIPWAIGGVPVTAIGAGAFQMRYIVSVIAPQTVTMIGENAYSECSLLASINLPQAATIGGGAFNNCSLLTSINLPQATAIGGFAFYYCGSLASVSLPQAATIGGGAFNNCSLLTSINLPQVTSIGDTAFIGCSLLTAVHMGQNAPAGATDVFEYITPPPNVYVTDPQATGWGVVWNDAPVVRPPLYGSNVTAQAYTLNGDTITEWPEGGGSVPYTAWTGTVTPADGTATVAIAHGNMPVLVTSAPCVLTLDPTGYGTAGVSRVSLSYYPGTNSFTFATNVITYSATPTVDTNGWNTLLIRRVSDGAWKGVGL